MQAVRARSGLRPSTSSGQLPARNHKGAASISTKAMRNHATAAASAQVRTGSAKGLAEGTPKRGAATRSLRHRRRASNPPRMAKNPKLIARPGSAFAGSRSSLKLGTWKPPQVDREGPASPSNGQTPRRNRLSPLRGGSGGGGGSGGPKSPISLNKSHSTVNLHAATAPAARASSAQRRARQPAALTYDLRNTVSVGVLPSYQQQRSNHRGGATVHAAAEAATVATAPAVRTANNAAKFFTLDGHGSGRAGGKHASFRSEALNLEVALQERLRRLDVAAGGGDVVSSLSIERFRVFSHLFDAIIEKDVSFSNLLQQVKTEYEASMRNGVNPSFLHDPEYARLTQTVQALQTEVADLREANLALEDENCRLQETSASPGTVQRLKQDNRELREAVRSWQSRCDRLENARGLTVATPDRTGRTTETGHVTQYSDDESGSSCGSMGFSPALLPKAPRPGIPQLRLNQIVLDTDGDEPASAFSGGPAQSTQHTGSNRDSAEGEEEEEGDDDEASGSEQELGDSEDEDEECFSDSASDFGPPPATGPNRSMVPGLSLSNIKGQSYHDEFLSHKMDFSESWREAAAEMERDRPDGWAADDHGGGGGGAGAGAPGAGATATGELNGGSGRQRERGLSLGIPVSDIDDDPDLARAGGGRDGGGDSARAAIAALQARSRGGMAQPTPLLDAPTVEPGESVDSETEQLMRELRQPQVHVGV